MWRTSGSTLVNHAKPVLTGTSESEQDPNSGIAVLEQSEQALKMLESPE